MADFTYNFQILIFRTADGGNADPDDDTYDIQLATGPATSNPTEVLSDSDGGSPTFEIGETLTYPGGSGTFLGVVTLNGEAILLVDNGSGAVSGFGFVSDPGTYDPLTSGTPADGVTDFIGADVADNAAFPVCFAAGTQIATPDGERAVETLQTGDLIITADGRTVPVKWIGRQTLHKVFTPADRFVPVRVKAGALGDGLPHSDLVLTTDHALILDGYAVNAGALVNGSTIVCDPIESLPERVTYYHVETEDHDVILANGAPAETFVDFVQRSAFDNHAEYLAFYGEERSIPEMQMPRISAARHLPASLRARLDIAVAA